MRLNKIEFWAMNNPIRRLVQKRVEFRWFEKMGMAQRGVDILEIGCGSGYGATLLSRLEPKSYVGIDLMPEQIALAEKRQIPGARFMQMDATDLSYFEDSSKSLVAIFGILHHMPAWRDVIKECQRVLVPGGKLFLEEIDGRMVRVFDNVLATRHPKDAFFTLKELEAYVEANGFEITASRYLPFIGVYGAEKK